MHPPYVELWDVWLANGHSQLVCLTERLPFHFVASADGKFGNDPEFVCCVIAGCQGQVVMTMVLSIFLTTIITLLLVAAVLYCLWKRCTQSEYIATSIELLMIKVFLH